MATLTTLQDKTVSRGFTRQIERAKSEENTVMVMVAVEIRSNNIAYAEKQVKSMFERENRRDFIGYNIVENVVPKQRLNDAMDYIKYLESLSPDQQVPAPSTGKGFREGVLDDDISPEDYFLTASEAAKRAGVSIATATRYLNTGHWHGKRKSRGANNCIRWYVDPNQPFTTKRSK